MRCQQCQIELLPGAHYCHACGSQIQPQCPTCQTLNPAGSSFCFSCGNGLTSEPSASKTPDQAGAGLNALVCPRCHERNEPASTYCYACGLPLDGANHRQGAVNSVPAFAMGRPGGFWVRFVAYVIDTILLGIAFSIIWSLISGESIVGYWFRPEAANTDLFSTEFWAASELSGGDLLSLILDALYFTGAIAIWATTIGKRPFRLYVVRTDGSKVGFGRALARNFAYYLCFFTFGIGFIMIAFRQDKRGLHDLICDTVVIRR